jgi:hypothetical protein
MTTNNDTRPTAMFIAGDPSLDFLNSIGTPVGTVVEWLAHREDLIAPAGLRARRDQGWTSPAGLRFRSQASICQSESHVAS